VTGRHAEEALRCVELIEAAYDSAADGAREVTLGRYRAKEVA
jgi:hypothetical protein